MGLTLEWIPNKPLYVHSFDEYLDLYKSFIDYIESENSIKLKSWDTDVLDNNDYKLCYSALYESMDIESPNEAFTETEESPMFTSLNFQPSRMTIITHEGTFQSDVDFVFSPQLR